MTVGTKVPIRGGQKTQMFPAEWPDSARQSFIKFDNESW